MEPAPFHSDVAQAPPGAVARWLRARDGKRLRAVFWTGGARGTALVLPGRTEYAEKYGPVVARLRDLDLTVGVIDWRGQGLSDRYPPFPEIGHVDDFRAYQRDLDALLAAGEIATRPRLLFCHSMGGCVGLRTLIERRDDFDGAVFSAPMWGLSVSPIAGILAGPVTTAAAVIGFGQRALPGGRRRAGQTGMGTEDNPLTSDPASFRRAADQVAAHPDLALGPPSLRWTSAAFREMRRLARLPSPDRPMLGFLGSDERVVSSAAIERRFSRAPDGDLMHCPGARHEILMERAEILAPVWARIGAFVNGLAP